MQAGVFALWHRSLDKRGSIPCIGLHRRRVTEVSQAIRHREFQMR
jgi:hypothetical protein